MGFRHLPLQADAAQASEKKDREGTTDLARFPIENPNPILTVSRGGKVLYANRASRPLLKGWRCEVGDKIPEPWLQRALASLEELAQKEIEVQCEERTFSIVIVPVADEDCVNLYGLDITGRNRAERQLEIEKAYFQHLFEGAPEAIVVVDNSSRIVRVNNEFTRMFGYSAEEAVGQSVDDLLAPENVRDDAFSLTQRVASGEQVTVETVRYRKDGTPVEVSVMGAPVRVAGGQIAVYGIYRDISTRKQGERIRDALFRISEATSLTNNLGNLLRTIHEILGSLIDTTNFYVALYDHEKDIYSFPYHVDTDSREDFASRPLHKRVTDYVRRAGKPLLAKQATFDWLKAQGELEYDGLLPKVWLGVPLKTAQKSIGVVAVQSYADESRYFERDMDLLTFVSGHIAMAIERKRAEEALRESEERFRAIFEATSDCILVWDRGYDYLYANQAAIDHVGTTPDKVIGKNIRDGLGHIPDFMRLWMSRIDDAFETGLPMRVEDSVPVGDRFVCSESVLSPIKDAQGNIMAVGVVYRDITERKQAEEALKLSEEKYRNLVEMIPSGLTIADLKENIIFANPAAVEILGYSGDELEGMNLSQIVVPEEMSKVYEGTQRRKGHEQSTYELTIRRKRGELRTLSVTGTPLADSSGQVRWTIGIFNDITELRNSEPEKQELREKLIRAQRMESLGVLAGGVAHDLNNILGPLVAYPELIRMKLPIDSPVTKQISNMEISAQRAADVVQDLLTMARRGRYEMTATDFSKVVGDYLQSPDFYDLRLRFPAAEIQVKVNEDCIVYGSEPHLYKLVMNLVMNALDAMPHGGRLTIETECRRVEKLISGYDNIEKGKYAILTVSDTGIGIDQKDIKRIFEPFYTKKEMGRSGSGLGLAIVYGVVKDHNGYVDVRSELNKGSDFVVYLPVIEKASAREKAAILNIRGSERILIVDDVAEQRELAATVLSSLGYKVDTVASGSEAVDYMRCNKVDVVILDMIMEPGFDGLDTYRKIIELHPGQKAIMTSGFSETDRVREAEKLGVGKYIRKPYTMQKLGKAIREVLMS